MSTCCATRRPEQVDGGGLCRWADEVEMRWFSSRNSQRETRWPDAWQRGDSQCEGGPDGQQTVDLVSAAAERQNMEAQS